MTKRPCLFGPGVYAALASISLSGCLGAPQIYKLEGDGTPRSAPVDAPAYSESTAKDFRNKLNQYGERISPTVQDLADHVNCEIINTYFEHYYLPMLNRTFNSSTGLDAFARSYEADSATGQLNLYNLSEDVAAFTLAGAAPSDEIVRAFKSSQLLDPGNSRMPSFADLLEAGTRGAGTVPLTKDGAVGQKAFADPVRLERLFNISVGYMRMLQFNGSTLPTPELARELTERMSPGKKRISVSADKYEVVTPEGDIHSYISLVQDKIRAYHNCTEPTFCQAAMKEAISAEIQFLFGDDLQVPAGKTVDGG